MDDERKKERARDGRWILGCVGGLVSAAGGMLVFAAGMALLDPAISAAGRAELAARA